MAQNPSVPIRRKPAEIISGPFLRFIELESGGAIALLGMTVLALVWANSPWGHSYEHLWHIKLALSVGDWKLALPLHAWVNDAAMAVFFFTVGMEIKKEIVLGELSTLSRAMLPVMGAIGGMIIPAGIYTAFHYGGPAEGGWGIPMATDIAFAVAAISVLGKRVPPPLKIFLLALAIADDLGAVLVIAIFYTQELNLQSLMISFVLLAVVYGMNLAGVRSFMAYWLAGALVWLFMLQSGVHATIAGVLLGLLTPTSSDQAVRAKLLAEAKHMLSELRELITDEDDEAEDEAYQHRIHTIQRLYRTYSDAEAPLDHLHHQLERWVVYAIMPVFALANAGVVFDMSVLSDPVGQMVALGVGLGLLLGKPIGVTLLSWVSVQAGIAALPTGVNWRAIFGTGLLAGIGFTMSLFVTALAFDNPVFTAGSKVGILAGSFIAAVGGYLFLRSALPEVAEE